MTYEQMCNSTLSEINIKQLGKVREQENQLRNTRLIMWEIRRQSRYIKRPGKIKVTDIMQIGEEKQPPVIFTKEQYEQLRKAWPQPTK